MGTHPHLLGDGSHKWNASHGEKWHKHARSKLVHAMYNRSRGRSVRYGELPPVPSAKSLRGCRLERFKIPLHAPVILVRELDEFQAILVADCPPHRCEFDFHGDRWLVLTR